jgi:hypothetical protein
MMAWRIEVTDTYGGEANYSWVTRHIVHSRTRLGAVQKFSRISGVKWRKVSDYGDSARYDSRSGATCFFIDWVDGEGDRK